MPSVVLIEIGFIISRAKLVGCFKDDVVTDILEKITNKETYDIP